MTDEEIHNIYLHMSGKAEGLVEATGKADFPVLFARAILEYEGMTKNVQNMASKSTYKEQLETKDEPVAWGMETDGLIYDVICPAEHDREEGEYTIPLYTTPQLKTKDEPVAWMNRHGACKTSLFMEVEAGAKEEYTIPVYTTPQRTWVGLTEDEIHECFEECCNLKVVDPKGGVRGSVNIFDVGRAIEAKLKEKNT